MTAPTPTTNAGYLLDTDILSNLLKRAPSPELIRRLAAVPPELQHTSSISVGELIYGAHRLGTHAARLIGRIEEALAHLSVLPFDEASARHYGAIRARLEQVGTPIGDADVRIASIALVGGLAVVTGNVRHFERVPALRVENWLVPQT